MAVSQRENQALPVVAVNISDERIIFALVKIRVELFTDFRNHYFLMFLIYRNYAINRLFHDFINSAATGYNPAGRENSTGLCEKNAYFIRPGFDRQAEMCFFDDVVHHVFQIVGLLPNG